MQRKQLTLPENVWNSPVIRKRLFSEASFEGDRGYSFMPYYWFNVPEADKKAGQLELRNYEPSPFTVDPHEYQQRFAEDIRKGLQYQEDHGGLWIVGWTHPPKKFEAIREDGDNAWQRLVMIWLDEDADPHFTVESEIPFALMTEHGTAYYINLCAEGYERWEKDYSSKSNKKDLLLKDGQMKKATLEALRT